MNLTQRNEMGLSQRLAAALYVARVSRSRQVGLYLIAVGLLLLGWLAAQIVQPGLPLTLLLWGSFGAVAAWGGALGRDLLQPERLLADDLAAALSRLARDIDRPETVLDEVSRLLHIALRTDSLTLWRLHASDDSLSLLRAEGILPPADLLELPLDVAPAHMRGSWPVADLPESATRQGLRAAGVRWVIPLRLGETLVGCVGLGQPMTGLHFSPRLLARLDELSGQVALLVQNALLRDDLHDAVQKLYLAYRRTTDVQEAERRNLATELHDDILGRLTTMALTLRQSQKQLGDGKPEHVGGVPQPPILDSSLSEGERRRPGGLGGVPPSPFSNSSIQEVKGRLEGLETETQAINRRLREITQGLHPTVLTDLGLISALRAYIDALARQPLPNSALKSISLTAQGFEQLPGPKKLERDLYYLTKQALDNAIKHAAAEQIFIHLRWGGEAISVTVRDTGRGMSAPPERLMGHNGHLGLISMHERALAWQGELTIHTGAEQGTTIRARLPIEQPSPGPAHLQAYTQYLS
jgi:signal transduction histidine kinase